MNSIFMCLAKACGLHLYRGLKNFAELRGPEIMSTEERVIVHFPARQRPLPNESDLELNFDLMKEMIACCMEQSLADANSKHEIPNLAEFEAGIISCMNKLFFLCHSILQFKMYCVIYKHALPS